MDTPNGKPKRGYFAAMVLGMALAALGQNGAASAQEISGEAIRDISRYCTACWRNARLPIDRWSDCTQEVLRRLLERLEPSAWDQVLAQETEERKEFIRAIDAVKKRTQRQRVHGPLVDENAAVARENSAFVEEREALHEAAGRLLSARQRAVVQMTCAGWSVSDIARELATTPERVSDEKYKAVHKLRAYFQTT